MRIGSLGSCFPYVLSRHGELLSTSRLGGLDQAGASFMNENYIKQGTSDANE
jgi:hypothetical protein